MKYSVVVPCYNEEKNIATLVKRFENVQESMKSEGFELVLVNNGSKDGTQQEIEKAMQEHDYIRTVLVPVNQGYGYGILQGLKACKGEYLGWIHADLQLPPEAFLDMAEKITDQENIFLKGRRHNRPLMDRLFTFGMSCFESLCLGERLWDINAQPTMIHRKFFESLSNPPYDFSLDLYFYYMAKKNGLEIERVPVKQQERMEGESSWNNGMKARFKLVKRTLSFSKELKEKYRN